MKAKIVYRHEETDVFMSDGGHATIHHNGEHLITTYYQNRLVTFDFETCEGDDLNWDEVTEGKAYIKDWKGQHKITDEIVKDAVNWLYLSSEEVELIKIKFS